MSPSSPSQLSDHDIDGTVTVRMARLIDLLASVVERDSDHLVRRLLKKRRPDLLPAPPSAPREVSFSAIKHYHGELAQWLDRLGAALRRYREGEVAMALLDAGESVRGEHAAMLTRSVSNGDSATDDTVGLSRHLMHLQEAAYLLIAYGEMILDP